MGRSWAWGCLGKGSQVDDLQVWTVLGGNKIDMLKGQEKGHCGCGIMSKGSQRPLRIWSEKQKHWELHSQSIYYGDFTLCNYRISLKSLYKAVTPHLGLKSAGHVGRKDGHEMGESRGIYDQQQLAPFAMELHTLEQGLEELKEGASGCWSWPCHVVRWGSRPGTTFMWTLTAPGFHTDLHGVRKEKKSCHFPPFLFSVSYTCLWWSMWSWRYTGDSGKSRSSLLAQRRPHHLSTCHALISLLAIVNSSAMTIAENCSNLTCFL